MLLYLDNCCFNRPFDDQSHLQISLETQAKLFVQQEILSGKYELLWSYVLEYENNKNPFEARRNSIFRWKKIAKDSIIESEEILSFGEKLINRGVKLYDALHIACAYIGGCDYLITVDRGLLNKKISEIKIYDPIDFIKEFGG